MNEHITQNLDLEETMTVDIDRGDKYIGFYCTSGNGRYYACPVSFVQFPIYYGHEESAKAAQIAHTRAVLKRAARFFEHWGS